jgi:hypothetical protein
MDVVDQSVPVSDLLSAVKNAVKHAGISSTDPGRDLRIRSVQLILNVVVTTKLGGGLDFRVPVIGWNVKIGGSQTTKRTHTIDITLVPARAEDRHELRSGDVVEDALVEAIDTIRRALAEADAGDDPLVLGTGTVELAFAVTDEGTISVGAEAELSDETTHILKMELAPTSLG